MHSKENAEQVAAEDLLDESGYVKDAPKSAKLIDEHEYTSMENLSDYEDELEDERLGKDPYIKKTKKA